MSVFVITQAHDYEGEQPIGVAASWHVATVIGRKWMFDHGYEDLGEWVQKNDALWELPYGSGEAVIRQEEVAEATHA